MEHIAICMQHQNELAAGRQCHPMLLKLSDTAVPSGWAADEARLAALALALGQGRPGDAPGAFEIDTRLLYR